MANKHGQILDGCNACLKKQQQLDSQLLLTNSPEFWSVSVPPDWKLLASEELQDTERLMAGLSRTCLSAPEELEA